MYPIEKYTYSVSTCRKDGKQKIYAISSYAGKPVVGIAVCSPDDTFSLEKGKELAAARCSLKIAKKRMKRAQSKVWEANIAYLNAETHFDKMCTYLDDATCEVEAAESHLAELVDSL